MCARPEISVVVPAYNEAAGLYQDLCGIRQVMEQQDAAWELIVVDDGSEDETAEIASGVEGARLVRHDRNRGYGAALKTGIRHAQGDLIVITDADGTYPAHYIPALVAELWDAEMVVGARTGEAVKIPPLRRPAKWLLNRLASLLAESPIPDLNSGLRAFRRAAALPFMSLLPSGFSFTSTITLAMLCNDMRVKYLPIDYHERKGASKIKPIQDTYHFFLLVFRTICYFNPLKVFMPPALLLMVGGGLKLIHDVVVERNIYQGEILLLLVGLQLAAFGLLADAVAKLRASLREG